MIVMIVIKKVVPMPAFQLGTPCAIAQKLMDAQLLLPLPEGVWEVRTREARQQGEIAQTGDYIKLDSIGMPYPVEKDWFESNHKQQEDGLYLQKAQPTKAWCTDELMCEEIRFLVNEDLLQWDRKTGFGAQLWGTWQTAGPDAVIVFDEVKTDCDGKIQQVDFHFVASDEFAATYEIISN
jgi:hypothetical protein